MLPDPESGSLAGKVLLAASFVAVLFLFAFASDEGVPAGTEAAVVVSNIQQVSDTPSPDQQIQARLRDGSVVNVRVPAAVAFPMRVGSVVELARSRSRWTGFVQFRLSPRPTPAHPTPAAD